MTAKGAFFPRIGFLAVLLLASCSKTHTASQAQGSSAQPADPWKGIYADAASCEEAKEGRCVFVSEEFFGANVSVQRAISQHNETPPPGLLVTPVRGGETVLCFRRVEGNPAPTARLVFIKFRQREEEMPVLVRANQWGGHMTLMIEPAPGG
jgi:hypothetical protein